MKWRSAKQREELQRQRDAAGMAFNAYRAKRYTQPLSKTELRAMAEAAASSGVAIQKLPAQPALPADLQLKPRQPKLR